MTRLRVLFLGDVVGLPGRSVLTNWLGAVVAHRQIDLVVANAENAAGGSGITKGCYTELVSAGVRAFTLGDHAYRRKAEVLALFASGAPICRPANYPPEAAGPEYILVDGPSGKVAIFCLQGRLFLKPADCPFHAADRVLEAIGQQASVILVDIHAEATSEKQTIGRYLAGRVSAVFGTHTHVPTADGCILPPGTAYITDVGMTGPYDSIIGRRFDRVLQATRDFDPVPFDVARDDPRMSGALVDIDAESGVAHAIELLHLGEDALTKLPRPTATDGKR